MFFKFSLDVCTMSQFFKATDSSCKLYIYIQAWCHLIFVLATGLTRYDKRDRQTKSRVKRLISNAVNDSRFPRAEAPHSQQTSISVQLSRPPRERKKPITTQWNKTVPQINGPVFVHSWGHILCNGTKVKRDKETQCCSRDWKKTCQGPQTTKGQGRQPVWPNKSRVLSRAMTGSDWQWVRESKSSGKWAGSNQPHSSMCSHILHNPAESCHCECPLNERCQSPD